MKIYQKYKRFLNLRRFLLGCLVWWLVMGVIYAVLDGRTTSVEKSKTETFFDLTARYAERVRLPLLERDVTSIRGLLKEAMRHEMVIFGSVLDHDDRLIASTGVQKLLFPPESETSPTDQVNYSQRKLANHERIVIFQKPVTYGGVKIGQIHLITTDYLHEGSAYWFALTALFGFFVMVLAVGYLNFRSAGSHSLRPGPERGQTHQSHASAPLSAATVSCPLCGAQNPITDHVFNSKRSGWQTGSLKLEASGQSMDTENTERIDRSPASQPQALYWIKRRVILRCAEIIQQLTI